MESPSITSSSFRLTGCRVFWLVLAEFCSPFFFLFSLFVFLVFVFDLEIVFSWASISPELRSLIAFHMALFVFLAATAPTRIVTLELLRFWWFWG